MREFVKMFCWGMAWFFVTLLLVAIALCVIVAYGIEALAFIAMIITAVLYLFTHDAEMARAFFYFGAISVVLCGLSVAFLGQVHKLFRAVRARLARPPLLHIGNVMKSVVLLAVFAFGLAACEAPPERYVSADGTVCKRIGYSFQHYWMNEKTGMLCHDRE